MIKAYELDFRWSGGTDTAACYASFVDQIATIMTNSNQFDVVESVKPTGSTYAPDYAVNCKVKADDESSPVTVLKISPNGILGDGNNKGFDSAIITAYYNSGTSTVEYTVGTQSSTLQASRPGIIQIWTTSRGILIRFRVINSNSQLVYGAIVVAKSNAKFPVIVTRPGMALSYTDYMTTELMHRTGLSILKYDDSQCTNTGFYGDVQTYNYPYTPYYHTSAKHTVMCPFAAAGSVSHSSYTKYAFWLPLASSGLRSLTNPQRITLDGKNFVTDGYFAIQDG